MLLNKTSSDSYVNEFKKRFENFCSKAPLLMSYTTTPTNVQIVDESTDIVYEVPFDYSIPVKGFIYGIKQHLIQNGCYPVIEKVEYKRIAVSAEEQAEIAMQEDIVLERVPSSREIKIIKKYRLDKIVVYRDIFIIQDLETGKMYRYHLKKSSIFFLKKLRNREKTPQESGQFFFEHAELLNELEAKEE